MGATYTRQSSYADGDIISAADTNDEFNQLLAAFASSTGHTHDGTDAEGGPITKLLGNTLTFGAATSGTDITITFDGETNDGVLKWMEDEDYFEFSDDILVASTEKLQFRDTAIYIHSSADGQLDLIADTEIQIAATTIDIDGNVDISGTLTIGGAGISEAELEILDGATVTTTEINILDGDTSASATTVADADRVVFNDAGTMKQVAVTDLAAYFDDEITAMPNLVTTAATTVGALNSGSITSGFGTIDTGSSTITTTGLITGGSLDIDDVLINGTTIGHTDDTDLITLANGVVTVAGEISVTTLDIGGTNITSTPAELNILDGDTTASSTTVADADRVVFNDAGTMKQVAVTDLAAYFDDEITAMPNLTSVGTLTTLTVDNVIINGSTIGHTGDTDLMTVASGVLTVAGEVDAASLDISGDADIDGTLEADAITVNGTALNTVIAGVTVTDATNSAHVLVTDNESTNEENLITFVENATTSTGNVGLEMDGTLTYNPSTGTVTSTIFKGNIDAVDGDFDGTLEADAITLDGTAITTVATLSTGISNGNLPVFTSGAADNDFLRIDGTSIEGRSASEVLSDIAAAPAAGSSNIVTTGAINSGSITSGFGAINNGSSAITTTGTITFGSLADGSITVTAFVDEDDMSSDSATLIPTQQSVKAYVDNNAGSFNSFQLEDDDGTEVTINNAKELKIIGSGVTTNFTDTSTGSDGDPFDLTITVDAAQTGITSLLATDIKIGEDDQTKIDFETADEIHFYAANVEQVYLGDNIFGPQSDSDVDLGSSSVRWKDAYIDSATITGAFTAGDGCTITTADNTAQLTLKSTDADSSVGPLLLLQRDSSSPADNDLTGKIEFNAEDSGGNNTTYATINTIIRDVTDGSEDGELRIDVRTAGTNREALTITPTEMIVNDASIDRDFRVESNGNANMLFVDAGNDKVGIGTNTPDTYSDFISSSNSPALVVAGTQAGLVLTDTDISGDDGTFGITKVGEDTTFNNLGAGAMKFSNNGGERLRLTSTGLFGVGTSNPTLDSSLAGVTVSSSSAMTQIHNANGAILKVSDPDNGSNRGAQFALINTTAVLNNCESGPIIFGTGNAERARLTTGTELLVGMTGAQGIGSVFDANCLELGPGYININRDDTASSAQITFGKNGAVAGSIVTTTSTTYNTTSDIRLKQDIEPLKATDKLMDMNPVSYAWRADPDGPRSMGFIAQEMKEIMPEAVSIGNDDEGMMSMDYGRITPILVSALQDAHKKIEELESRIAAMESK